MSLSPAGRGIIYLALSIVFQTGSLAFGKFAAVSMTHFSPADILSNRLYALSLACLALQAITWQLALTRYPLAHAYAAMSIVYVNVLIISALVLHETITAGNAVGSVLIITGVTMLNTSGRSDAAV